MLKAIINILLLLSISSFTSYALDIQDIGKKSNPDNPLRYTISFSTSDSALAYVTYWFLDKKDDSIGFRTPVSNIPNLQHELEVIGLPASGEVFFQVNAFNQQTAAQSEVKSLFTKKIDDPVEELTVYLNTENASKGFIAMARGILGNFVYTIYTKTGELIWYTPLPTTIDLQVTNCGAMSITPDQYFISANDCHSLLGTTLLGDTIFNISNIDTSVILHHHLIKNEANQIATLFAEAKTIPGLAIPEDSITVVGDGFMVVSQEGDILQRWSPFDHFDPYEGEDFNDFWNPVFGSGSIDWLHANGIEQDLDGNYVLSFSQPNQIVKVSAETGEVMWVLGDNGTLAMDASSRFIFQHGLSITEQGTYLFFDNGGLERLYSRVLEFEVDEVNQSATLIWEYRLSDDLYSTFLSNALRLPNGNTLIASGLPGILLEVNPEGETVWLVDNEELAYRVEFFDNLFNPSIDIDLSTIPNDICINHPDFELTGIPAGGYFTGGNNENNHFDPQELGIGEHTLTYHYAWESKSKTVTIHEALPIPVITQEGDSLIAPEGYVYQWFVDGEELIDATNYWITIPKTGEYEVIIKDDKACSQSSDPFYAIALGEEANSLNHNNTSLQISPNPAQDYLTIHFQQNRLTAPSITWQIYNTKGQALAIQQQACATDCTFLISINELNLSSGIYFLKVINEEKVFVEKFIVE